MRIVYSPEAIEDLRATLEYIAERNPSAAERLAGRVFALIEKLADRDFEGPVSVLRSGERVRSWPVRPFRVYYQRTPEAFLVLRIYHHARRPITE